MNILLLGGGRQLGLTICKKIKSSKHSLTVVNRGLTSNFDQLIFVKNNFSYIKSSKKEFLNKFDLNAYDLIIDTCAYHEDDFQGAEKKLINFNGIYVLISSVYVYSNSKNIVDEKSCVQTEKDFTFNSYTMRKINCENKISNLVRSTIIIRSGILLGPHDHTKRLQFWLNKIKNFEKVPLLKCAHLQLLHPDDLIDFIFLGVGMGISGIFNTCGTTLNYEHFLKILQSKVGCNEIQFNSEIDYRFQEIPFFEMNVENIYSSTKAQDLGFIPSDSEQILRGLIKEFLNE